MKDLMSLVPICKADLDSLGIKYGRVSDWTINTRAKCRLGQYSFPFSAKPQARIRGLPFRLSNE